MKPGFQGKVVLKFAIASSGEITKIVIESSTTDFSDFDNEIKGAVNRWIFSKISSGKTVVTIPFTFTE
jgi:TonB family protein